MTFKNCILGNRFPKLIKMGILLSRSFAYFNKTDLEIKIKFYHGFILF